MTLTDKEDKPEFECQKTAPDYFEEYCPKMISKTSLLNLENYQIKQYNDSVYEGQIVDKKRHGKGIMKYKSGRVYEGNWENDFRHGKGFERYSNGNIYEGDYAYGKAEGRGIYTWKNGEIYDGQWKNGLKHGDGVWKGIHGDSYIGEWKFSKADGYGVHIWKNGDRYEGEWKQCLKHGQGTDIFANGDIFIGTFQNGKPHGNGRFEWKDGSSYAGKFEEGTKNGFGRWRKGPGSHDNSYEGQFFRDKKQGFGVFRWESGNLYRGQYCDDVRHGIGEMRWTDGSSYIGEWEQGIQHGLGRMCFADGSQKEGLFNNNIFKSNLPLDTKKAAWLGEDFNIMTLAPEGLVFNDTLQFNGNPTCNRARFGTAHGPRRNCLEEMTRRSYNGRSYSRPPVLSQPKSRLNVSNFQNEKLNFENDILLVEIKKPISRTLKSRKKREIPFRIRENIQRRTWFPHSNQSANKSFRI